MDKFWSIFGMPIGLFICFGPALLVWVLTEWKNPPADLVEHRRVSGDPLSRH